MRSSWALEDIHGVNHLYWVAGTAPERNQGMLEQMWKLVSNHIQDVHVAMAISSPSVHMVYWTRRHTTRSGYNQVRNYKMIT